MIEKNLKIRNKFINKLLIKIEDLNNDFILLTNVDNKIFKNTINQKGGFEEIKKLEVAIDLFEQKINNLQYPNLKKNKDSKLLVENDIFTEIISSLRTHLKKMLTNTPQSRQPQQNKTITYQLNTDDINKILKAFKESYIFEDVRENVEIKELLKIKNISDNLNKLYKIFLRQYPTHKSDFLDRLKPNKTLTSGSSDIEKIIIQLKEKSDVYYNDIIKDPDGKIKVEDQDLRIQYIQTILTILFDLEKDTTVIKKILDDFFIILLKNKLEELDDDKSKSLTKEEEILLEINKTNLRTFIKDVEQELTKFLENK